MKIKIAGPGWGMAELGPEYSCVPLEDALDQICEAEEKTYITPWQEITEDQYSYWLKVLPPRKWKTVGGVNLFQLSEFTISDITRHCAAVQTETGTKYFTAERRVSDSYETLAAEIKEIL